MASPAHAPTHREHQHETSYPHDKTLAACETRGIRHNRKLEFDLHFTGQEMYDLRALVEKSAIDAGKRDDFMAAHDAVLMWDKISAQARQQGF
jgi:hypothetical protein